MTDHDKASLIGFQEAGSHSESISTIQGADETWLVQLIWAIYYIAGTLIFTSIVGVTVIELLRWVPVCCFVGFAAKMLALFILVVIGENRKGPRYQVDVVIYRLSLSHASRGYLSMDF